jgi:hypothetical protein
MPAVNRLFCEQFLRISSCRGSAGGDYFAATGLFPAAEFPRLGREEIRGPASPSGRHIGPCVQDTARTHWFRAVVFRRGDRGPHRWVYLRPKLCEDWLDRVGSLFRNLRSWETNRHVAGSLDQRRRPARWLFAEMRTHLKRRQIQAACDCQFDHVWRYDSVAATRIDDRSPCTPTCLVLWSVNGV